MKAPIYLDHAASTPVYPEAIECMLSYFDEHFANPNSRQHEPGKKAQAGIDRSKEQISELINCSSQDIYFTDSATTSLQKGISFIIDTLRIKGRHILYSATEHAAIIDHIPYWESLGYEFEALTPDKNGIINKEELNSKCRADTVLMILMMINNETGVLHDINEWSQVCHEKGLLLLSDASQALGKLPISMRTSKLDFLVGSSHKMCGPKGAACFVINNESSFIKDFPIADFNSCCHHPTPNVPSIVGMGKASEINNERLEEHLAHAKMLDTYLKKDLRSSFNAGINGAEHSKSPYILNVCLPEMPAQILIESLQNKVAIATGSACSSGQRKGSHVLKAMGFDAEHIAHSIRISTGFETNSDNLLKALDLIKQVKGVTV
ncbi:MAG TPA: aminotransferase class V-fold PLP-dependent enzyme [Bacteroidetes bacterium]|nr:aminotransferase class V-fold PLP-dependent enzyme [Bacteroidota bacterium]